MDTNSKKCENKKLCIEDIANCLDEASRIIASQSNCRNQLSSTTSTQKVCTMCKHMQKGIAPANKYRQILYICFNLLYISILPITCALESSV